MSIEIEPRTKPKRSLTAIRSRAAVGEQPAPTPAPPRLPGRRNPKWIALGIVAICLGGLLSYVIYSRVASEVPVVAVANTVYRGSTVTRADLTTVTITPTSGVAYVAADELAGLVGKKAALDLAKGSVLTPESVSSVKLPADAHSVVGLKLANGRAPLGLLFPGSRVRLVALPAADSAPGTADEYRGKSYQGVVVDQQADPDGAGILLNVDLASAQAHDVSVLAAQDRIALVRDADR